MDKKEYTTLEAVKFLIDNPKLNFISDFFKLWNNNGYILFKDVQDKECAVLFMTKKMLNIKWILMKE